VRGYCEETREWIGVIMAQISYQIALVNATYIMQNVLTNKQVADATSGTIASNLLQVELQDSEAVLAQDTDNIQSVATTGNQQGWTTADTNAYNQSNQVYQNDSTVCQTGQANATTSVNVDQSQVSQDGTNLSNFLSLSNVLMQIGNFMSNLLQSTYT